MDTFSLLPVNQANDAFKTTINKVNKEGGETNNNLTDQSFKGRLCRFAETTTGKIILGSTILVGVGIVGALIAIPAILLPDRAVTTSPTGIVPTSRPDPQHKVATDTIQLVANNLSSQVSKTRLRERLEGILTFGPRDNDFPSSSDAYNDVVKNLATFLERMGVKTDVQTFSYGNKDALFDYRDNPYHFDDAKPKNPGDKDCKPKNMNSCNLCALIPGKTSNFIVVGAHLDTVKDSPGANDNGSSVVALLEAIRIFKQARQELNNPVLFCFWGSKERPSEGENEAIGFGSRFFLHEKGYEKIIRNLTRIDQGAEPRLQCYLNLELAGTKNRVSVEPVKIEPPLSGPVDNGTLQLTEMYAEFLDNQNITYSRTEPNSDTTDVDSFYHHNIPALTITAGPPTSCYHKPCDNISEVDFDVLSNISRTVIYALAKLSLGEGVKPPDS